MNISGVDGPLATGSRVSFPQQQHRRHSSHIQFNPSKGGSSHRIASHRSAHRPSRNLSPASFPPPPSRPSTRTTTTTNNNNNKIY